MPKLTVKRLLPFLLIAAAPAFAGCGSPSAANIQLRKENSSLRNELDVTKRQRAADLATIKAMQRQNPSVPNLDTDRLEKLFTAHGLQFGRLTGGADLDPQKPGQDGLKVYVVPTDASGEQLKAAGSFTVEAFDLDAKPARIGSWYFDTDQAMALWVGGGLIYDYVLPCPWQTVPEHRKLMVKATFTDELTRREFSAEKKVELPRLPTASTPPTASSTQP